MTVLQSKELNFTDGTYFNAFSAFGPSDGEDSYDNAHAVGGTAVVANVGNSDATVYLGASDSAPTFTLKPQYSVLVNQTKVYGELLVAVEVDESIGRGGIQKQYNRWNTDTQSGGTIVHASTADDIAGGVNWPVTNNSEPSNPLVGQVQFNAQALAQWQVGQDLIIDKTDDAYFNISAKLLYVPAGQTIGVGGWNSGSEMPYWYQISGYGQLRAMLWSGDDDDYVQRSAAPGQTLYCPADYTAATESFWVSDAEFSAQTESYLLSISYDLIGTVNSLSES